MTEIFHGTWWDQHQPQSLDELMAGRFARLLPENQDPVDGTDLQRLAEAMTSEQEPRPHENPCRPLLDRTDEGVRPYVGFLGFRRGQVFPQKLQAPETCITPNFGLESVAGAGVDLDFVRDSLLLQQLLQLVGFLDRDGRIGIAVQD